MLATLASMNTSLHAASVVPPRRLRIGVASLAPGMYVAALDRPWLDTPFLLEGFVLDDRAELETLRQCCSYVYVDPDRSLPSTVFSAAVARSLPAASGTPDAAQASSQSQQAQRHERLRRLARAGATLATAEGGANGLLRRTSHWLRRRLGSAPAADGARRLRRDTLAAARRALPAGTAFVATPAITMAFDDAVAQARPVLVGALSALQAVLDAMRDESAPSPAELSALAQASQRLANTMLADPSATLWLVHTEAEFASHAGTQPLRVAVHLLALGRSMGLEARTLGELALAALLADAGMARLPRAWLQRPGMLTAAEYGRVKEHVSVAVEALTAAGGLPAITREAIAQHHERLDGSGYPAALAGEAIGAWGRMLAIADCYTALLSQRPYAEPLSPQQAMTHLHEWAGTMFDGPLVEQFGFALGLFPVGGLVALRGGEIALVHRTAGPGGEPVALLQLSDAQHRPLPRPVLYDTSHTRTKSAPFHLRIAQGLPDGAFPLPAPRHA